MSWWDRLLGRHEHDRDDEEAIADLRSSFKRVRVRTDRLVADYLRAAVASRAARRKKDRNSDEQP